MKQFLTLLSVIFFNSCMNNSVTPPIAEKQPYEMINHNDERVDDYYWMRLTDDQKTAENYDETLDGRVKFYIDFIKNFNLERPRL